MQVRNSLKFTVVGAIWLASHALIPIAGVIYPFVRAVSALRTLLKFSFTGIHLIIVGLLTRAANLSQKRRKAADTQNRFAFVSHVLPPEWSGQAVVIKRLLDGIDGSQYCLISSQDYGTDALRDFIGRLPGTYYWLPGEFQIRSLTDYTAIRLFNLFSAILIRGFHIAYMLVGSGCRTVIAASGEPIDLPAAYVASCVTGARFIPYLFDDFTYQWPVDNGRKEARFIEKIIFRRANPIIVPNEFLQQEIYRRHPGVPTAVVRNPAGSLAAAAENPARAIDGEQGASPRIITYTGAIYHINLSAFRNLIAAVEREDMPPVEIHLYAAQDKAWLEEKGICSPSVILHGHVPAEKVGSVQKNSDILFIGFAFDSMIPELVSTSAPGKLGDYLATGVPILAHVPRECFVAWYLKEYECGVVIDEDSTAAVATGIKRLLNDAALRSRLRKNALDRARQDFDPSVARKAFLSAIHSPVC